MPNQSRPRDSAPPPPSAFPRSGGALAGLPLHVRASPDHQVLTNGPRLPGRPSSGSTGLRQSRAICAASGHHARQLTVKMTIFRRHPAGSPWVNKVMTEVMSEPYPPAPASRSPHFPRPPASRSEAVVTRP